MRREFFTIGEAAKMAGFSIHTLRRLEQKGLIKFERINGRRYISITDLRQAPILSLGRAAELISLSYYTLRKLAKEKKYRWQKALFIEFHFLN